MCLILNRYLIGQWEVFITDQKDSEEGWLWSFFNNEEEEKKTYQKCSIVTLYAIWIGTGIIHLPFDSVYVKTLLREWPLFLRKGWAIFSELQIISWGQVVQEYFCDNCQTLPSKNSSPSVSPVSNKLLVWKYDFFNKPPLYEPVSSLYKVYKIKYIPMFLWA